MTIYQWIASCSCFWRRALVRDTHTCCDAPRAAMYICMIHSLRHPNKRLTPVLQTGLTFRAGYRTFRVMHTVHLAPPYSRRQAATELRERLVAHLVELQPAVGEPFFTDAELVEATTLSRSTVRRALDDLQRDGWIDRRIGQGSFVGPRAIVPVPSRPRTNDLRKRQTVRLAVLIYGVGDLAHDWYTPLVLGGLDAAADEHGVSVELLGTRDRDADAISRRITQTNPDVLACLTNDPREAFVLRDAQRLGIPCIVTGTPLMRLGLPCIREDNVAAVRLAVERLGALGHRRIGLAIQRQHEPWVLERHQAFCDSLQATSAPARSSSSDTPVFWFPQDQPSVPTSEQQEGLLAFVRQQQLTAILAASELPAATLAALAGSGRLAIPREISVVSFEQDGGRNVSFGGVAPTWIDLGLADIGRQLAKVARDCVERTEDAAGCRFVRCQWVEGASTAPARA